MSAACPLSDPFRIKLAAIRIWLRAYESTPSGQPAPRRDGDIVSAVQDLGLACLKPVGGQNRLRRPLGHAGEARLAIRQAHPWRLRKPERVVAVQKHREHAGTADDRYSAGTHAGVV